jgi:hypothetical protein
MIPRLFASIDQDPWRPLAVILGTNEIASAVAVHLHQAGWRIVLSHDPSPPVIRRKMAFHDALFGEPIAIDGIEGAQAETTIQILSVLGEAERVAVTPLHLMDILPLRALDVLVDARMQKQCVTPDFRWLAQVTVGLGPKFQVGVNCDIAVETHPARTGAIVDKGSTEAADGISRSLGGVGRDRFIYSDRPGSWRGFAGIGRRVYQGFLLGFLHETPVHAPLDGVIRGMPRDGTQIPPGVKLIEIDPRGRDACWTGMDERGRGIAEAAVRAIRIRRERELGLDQIAGRPRAVKTGKRKDKGHGEGRLL